jgi:single-stranded-DNA-specific exonuclease
MTCHNSKAEPIRLSNGTILDPFIVKLLGKRGVIGKEAVTTFLEPKLADLPSPFLMKGMNKAINIVVNALIKKQSILIWGDYDVDGTTATAVLLKFFKSLGCNADYYIPNRLTEGYGLQENGLKKISKNKNTRNTVLLTVDNGISANKAVELAKNLGYKVIITDHHTPPLEKVAADAILNPKQSGCKFPDKNLAGVGVAFYLAMGVRSHLNDVNFVNNTSSLPNLKLLLDLVAIGTVADMVPLHGINRILVRAGMETLEKKSNEGLTALCRANSLDPGFIRSEDISFQLAPKINAAGRLGDANKAINLFLSKTKEEGNRIARDLVKGNEFRKNINLSDFNKAKLELETVDIENRNSIVVYGDYHIGVAGIVASNLVEKYKKPAIVLCKSLKGIYRGSARSVSGIDLYVALEECSKLLLGFGGHKMAGGMTIDQININKFRVLFERMIHKQTNGKITEETKRIDADIPIGKLFKNSILRQLHLFEPFGSGNPQPIFRDTMARFCEIKPIGKDKSHLRLSFRKSGQGENGRIKGIAFGFGMYAGDFKTSKEKEIYYTPSMNFFRGKRSWQVRITDIVFNDA